MAVTLHAAHREASMRLSTPVALAFLLLAAAGTQGASTVHAEPQGADAGILTIIPSATEPPKVLVLVENQGSRPAGNVKVELWLDEERLGRQSLGGGLGPGERAYAQFMRPMQMTQGLHTFKAEWQSVWVRRSSATQEIPTPSRPG